MTAPADDAAPDIVARLRAAADGRWDAESPAVILRDAADEIERLRRATVPGYEAGRAAGLKEAAITAGMASWRHAGIDTHSQGMDAGARHQVQECVRAIRALIAHPPVRTPDSEE